MRSGPPRRPDTSATAGALRNGSPISGAGKPGRASPGGGRARRTRARSRSPAPAPATRRSSADPSPPARPRRAGDPRHRPRRGEADRQASERRRPTRARRPAAARAAAPAGRGSSAAGRTPARSLGGSAFRIRAALATSPCRSMTAGNPKASGCSTSSRPSPSRSAADAASAALRHPVLGGAVGAHHARHLDRPPRQPWPARVGCCHCPRTRGRRSAEPMPNSVLVGERELLALDHDLGAAVTVQVGHRRPRDHLRSLTWMGRLRGRPPPAARRRPASPGPRGRGVERVHPPVPPALRRCPAASPRAAAPARRGRGAPAGQPRVGPVRRRHGHPEPVGSERPRHPGPQAAVAANTYPRPPARWRRSRAARLLRYRRPRAAADRVARRRHRARLVRGRA